MEYTVEHARKILTVIDSGLVRGMGEPEPGKMCVEAAICYSLGLPHGDDPKCVADAVRAFKIRLNDSIWSSDLARANGLRALAIAQLGSKDVVSSPDFSRLMSERTIRQIVPLALRAAAKVIPAHAAALESAARRCETEGTRDAVLAGLAAADAADAANAAANAAYAAAYASASAADAAYAAADAAAEAAEAAAYAADAAAYAAAASRRDEVLTLSADIALGVLRDLNAPGVRLWDEVNAG